MGKIFDLDNPVWSLFSKLVDAFVLSILWTLTSLPIVTIGASTSAMYYVLLKLHDDKFVKPVREYFKAFKEDFKKATIVWIPLLLLIFIGVCDVYITHYYGGEFGKIVQAVFICMLLFLVIFAIYVFPLIGRFENTIKQTVKNAMLMPIKHFGFTLFILFITVSVVMFAVVFPPITLFLPGVMAFAISIPMHRVFAKYTPDEGGEIEKKYTGETEQSKRQSNAVSNKEKHYYPYSKNNKKNKNNKKQF